MPDASLDRVKLALAHRYRISEELPGGGMAVVWLAEDLRHNRPVAVKVLEPDLAAAVGTDRFLREIDVLARLEHPHILTLIDSGEVEGLPWYVMPFVEGQSLEDRISREGPLPVDEVIRIGREVADALQYAHERRVIHRDVKPANVLLSDGHAVVADFGIAGALDESVEARLTETGVSIGSPAYMSPEQASGERDLDERTDIYSLGCVLYEMVAGEAPFSGSLKAVVTNKVMGTVRPLAEIRPDAPPALDAVIARAMSVERADRFTTAEALGAAVADALPHTTPEPSGRRRTVASAVAIAAVIAVAVFAIYRAHAANERKLWIARQLTAVEKLADDGSYAEALALAREVEEVSPADTTLARLWPRFSFTVPIHSDPSGARVYRRRMDAPEDTWEYLGETPLEGVRFAGIETAIAYMEDDPVQLRFELDGHRDVDLLEIAILGVQFLHVPRLDPVRLTPEDSLPEGMVRIPGFTSGGHAFGDYYIDRYEVTNRAFAAFVAAGGYRNPDYWTEPLLRDGEELPFEEAMRLLVDQTGRPGPSTWRLGTYPDGEEDYPVGGVSWYEAAAYARWAGGQLPTTTHWGGAVRLYRETSYLIVPRSNLGSFGPREVGLNRDMTTLGVYDMVGNVREWCYNPTTDGGRATRGGAWGEAPFQVGRVIPKDPFDRDVTNGLRLVRTFDPDSVMEAIRGPRGATGGRDYSIEKPVSDAEYAIYRRLYAYDPAPLNDVVQAVDTFDAWVRETVAFDVPYGERGGAYLYLPKAWSRPLQPVLYWGGSPVLSTNDVDDEYTADIDFLVRGGRAVAQPIWKGAFQRDDSLYSTTSGSWKASGSGYRDVTIQWMKDLSRTVDYLETREDLDASKVGFYGLSWGSEEASIALAVERRIRAAVLNVGGLEPSATFYPEIDPLNFAPHVSTPVLMINGEYDVVFPLETSQRPMFELLGTNPEDKRHFVSPASHFVPRDDLIRETLGWFDRYLGVPARSLTTP